ncbi:UNVERIFIED_CONTAM: Fatty acid amide hydrolase [Sesamum indicum]
MGILKAQGVVYKPVDEVDLGPESDEFYIRANVKAPRMAGLFVKVFTWFLESSIFGGILLYFLKRNNLIHKLVSFAQLQESPLFVPLHPYQGIIENEVKCLEPDMSPPEKVQQAVDCLQSLEDIPKSTQLSFERWTILDYARAYTSGQTTPKMVADRFIASVHESSNRHLQMSFFINYNAEDILKQATESTARHAQGAPISILDGVPVAIKDEIDCMPYPTTGGTKWLHKVRQCKNDACCVSRLRACGAIIVGKTNMHELGAGISGINPHYGAARNPYNRSKITGGSSSGSAAVVAAGLCPVALGVDGGGSVRLPAALCGVVGLKPTFARVPHNGVLPINYTVGMVGILAATVEDALITYAAISGGLPSDHSGITMPKIGLPLLKSANYMSSDFKMAIYRKWFNDCSDDIRECCSNAVAKLSDKYGWQSVEVTIPDIEVMRLAHYLTIGSECSDSIASYLENINRAELGWDVRVGLSVYSSFHSHEYLNAQRISVTAYTIEDDALKTGELDYINGAALVRYQIAGNFLGLPAVTVPALCKSGYKKPEVFFDMLAC